MSNVPNLGAPDDHFIANNCNFAAPRPTAPAKQCNSDRIMMMNRAGTCRAANQLQNRDITTPENYHIKRPMNAFMCWAQVARRRLADEKPELRNTELSKILGQMWKELNKEQKTPYIMKAEQLRHEHKTQYPNYKYRPKRKRSSKFSIVPPPELLRPKSGSLLGQEAKLSHTPEYLQCDIVKEENVLGVNGNQACTNIMRRPPTAFSQLRSEQVALIGTNNSIVSHAGYPKTYQTLPHPPQTTDGKSDCPLTPYIHYIYTND